MRRTTLKNSEAASFLARLVTLAESGKIEIQLHGSQAEDKYEATLFWEMVDNDTLKHLFSVVKQAAAIELEKSLKIAAGISDTKGG